MKLRNTLIALTTVWFAVSAIASGNHAGGHGHDASDIGQPGQAGKVSRTIEVDMSDKMRFTPGKLVVNQGETIRFVIKNSGALKHEFVMGNAKALKAHHKLMQKFPEMEHADANMLTVAPGQSGELIWQFTKPGPVDFACLQPDHYEAGMKGAIQVDKGRAIAKFAKSAEAKMADSRDMTQGEIRKIDKEGERITIKHGDIKNLGMPPMTMVFKTSDATLLDKALVGDKVLFKAKRENGALVVAELQKIE